MINMILIFPIIACILVLIIKNKTFNTIMVNLYAIVHFVITVMLASGAANKTGIPYFAVDNTNMIFLLVLSLVFLMVAIYNTGYVKTLDVPDRRISHYSFMILVFVLSMTGTILSTDLGVAWVLIEATTLSSAYLIYFNKTKHSIEAAWKYVFICSIGIALAFVGIILLNISSGAINSLNFAQLYEHASQFDLVWLKLAFVFMLFGFGAKMGLAPVHFWLPDAHSEAPSPISALLSAALLNSAFLVIVRVFKIMEIADCTNYARIMLFVMGFISLFVTTVFVYHIKNYKRMLAYSSIENMGILAIGLALGPVAYYAVVLHLIGHSLAKASFFLTSGNILELFDSKRIKSVSGIVNADIKTGWLWVASFLAICAFPTSVLFMSEFLIIKAMILQKHYVLCVLFVLLLTIILFGIGRVVIKMTFGELSEDKAKLIEENRNKVSLFMYIPQVIMLVLVFVLGIYIPCYLNEIIKLAAGAF
uniref:NADH dehydrogenase n=1 Tax=uncultured Candidatus Melainabacteria bacterium TaxID=2682970 RepID=A0A650EL71_9BACT|nr:NADH dehydrogenase [uncultured Candidatus Melainabacteria bacterium]